MNSEKKDASYLIVYQDLRDKIISGAYPLHHFLPSKRTCALQYNVSLITIEHAMRLLDEEGYITPRPRRGYEVIYQSGDLFNVPVTITEPVLERKREDYTKLFPYPQLASTMRHVLSEYQEEILERSEGSGCLILRQAIAAYLSRSRDMHVSPDQIIIAAGSESAYALIVQMLSRKQIYGIEDPGYARIKRIYENEGVRVDRLKMGPNGIQTSELQRTHAHILHVTPVSSYPTGVSADAGKRQEYLKWAKERQGILIEDDYASEFAASSPIQKTLFAMEPESSVIYLNSFTRTIAPSFRISYMILPARRKEELLGKIADLSCNVSTFDQLTVAQLLNNGGFERHLNRVKRQQRMQKHMKSFQK
ncbi:MAG: PLP-dependent aminotransferase family protein [Lactimicrobium sp.]|jgi:GntR family transcriptional regulator/MocR family aminotransferase|uniref:MocR-like pyridoxine biosynthesis transcription factor PdxR n=1 Tax=Lactimicrobium sp. TaxID=2563780 RepID=UPI002F35DEFD